MTIDPSAIRELFPGAAEQVYLDSAAVGLVSRRTAAAVTQVIDSHSALGGAAKPGWQDTAGRARRAIATLVGGSAGRLAFTQNTSTGLALVTNGLNWRPGDNVVLPAEEFPSNSYPWRQLRRHGVEVRELAMVDGHADLAELDTLVDDHTRVLTLSAVQYSSGYRYDLARLGEVCRAHNALFVVDGTQAVGAVRVETDSAGIDVLAVSGHKWMLGPLGAGFVHLSERAMDRLQPSTVGWCSVEDPFAFDHEANLAADARRFESGTENFGGIAGLLAAVELVDELGVDTVESLIIARTEELADLLLEAGLHVRRDPDPARWSGILIATTGGDDARSHRRLLEEGVRCSLRGGLRFAPHIFTNSTDLHTAAEILHGSPSTP